ncbi:MAG: YbaN family protein [Deinococcales bacterium]
MISSPIRWLWFAAGWVCVGLGFIGAAVPVMPSTVFFVAAAACFARSSPRFEAWVLNLPGVGQLVRDYRAGLGMKRRTKILVVCITFTACAVSAWRAPPLVAKIGAGVLGVVGIWYVWTRVPTREIVEAARDKT